MIHELKIKEKYWRDVWNGKKSFEIRKNDRGFKIGDVIRFIPIDEDGNKIDLDPAMDKKYNRYLIRYIFEGGSSEEAEKAEEWFERIEDILTKWESNPQDRNGIVYALYEDYKLMKDLIGAYAWRHNGTV